MSKIVVQKINVPSTSLAMRSLPHIDFADAFKCQLPENQPQNIDSVTRAIFLTMPQWIAELLELRNKIVRPLGLKTSIDALPSNGEGELKPGTAVGVFEVLDRGLDEEIMLGEDDKHLDYRVSVRLEREKEKCWVVVSTVVKFNNWLGRAYFVPVRPVHKIIVPAMMRYGLGSTSTSYKHNGITTRLERTVESLFVCCSSAGFCWVSFDSNARRLRRETLLQRWLPNLQLYASLKRLSTRAPARSPQRFGR